MTKKTKYSYYPLDNILKKSNLDEKSFFKLVLNEIIGWHDNNYMNKILENCKDENYNCIRGTNQDHKEIYTKLYFDKLEKNEKKFFSYSKKIKDIIIELYGKNYYDFSEYNGCHIWGFSRNIYWNNALWNVWYIPRCFSYLTDSDNGSDIGKSFRKELKITLLKNEDVKKDIKNHNQELYEKGKYYVKIIKNSNKKKQTLKNISNQLVLINIKTGDTTKILDENFNLNPILKDKELENYW